MPFTFFAHQAPVLPMVQRRPDRWDGVALVAGSMAPDLAYVTNGWGYGPAGIAPLALPDGGFLHLRDYRNIARAIPAWWMTLLSALIGALTHLFLDAFTHNDGAVVEAVGFLRARLFAIGDHTVALYSVLQYGGTVVLGIVAIWFLLRMGEARQFARPADRSSVPPSLTPGQTRAFWTVTGAGIVGGLTYAWSRAGVHHFGRLHFSSSKSTVFIAGCWVAFLGLVTACLALRPAARAVD